MTCPDEHWLAPGGRCASTTYRSTLAIGRVQLLKLSLTRTGLNPRRLSKSHARVSPSSARAIAKHCCSPPERVNRQAVSLSQARNHGDSRRICRDSSTFNADRRLGADLFYRKRRENFATFDLDEARATISCALVWLTFARRSGLSPQSLEQTGKRQQGRRFARPWRQRRRIASLGKHKSMP